MISITFTVTVNDVLIVISTVVVANNLLAMSGHILESLQEVESVASVGRQLDSLVVGVH